MNANREIIAELRRVLGERDAAREQLDLTKRELGRWVDREAQAVRECDELRAQRGLALGRLENAIQLANQYAKERDAAIARITEVGVMVATSGNALAKDAYRRGAEAMREACALALLRDGLVLSRERAANVVRALPIPEEP